MLEYSNEMTRGRWSSTRAQLLWGADPLEDEEAMRLRQKLEAWLDEMPTGTERAECERRLKDFGSNYNHLSAVQELALNHEFTRRGYGIERHPEMAGTTRRPDFRITTPYGPVIVEAVVAGDSSERQGLDNRLYQLIDDLQRVHAGLHILASVQPPIPESFPTRLVRAFLEKELQRGWGAEPDDPRIFRSEKPPLEIEFRALAKTDAADASAIQGFGFGEARSVDSPDRIREALQSKCGIYGQLTEPYVICVFPTMTFRRLEHEREALIGSQVYDVSRETREGTWRTEWDGFFFERDRGRRRHQEVSAVVVLEETRKPGGSIGHFLRVYHNPFAARPLPRETFEEWPQLVLQREGDSIAIRWVEPPGAPVRHEGVSI